MGSPSPTEAPTTESPVSAPVWTDDWSMDDDTWNDDWSMDDNLWDDDWALDDDSTSDDDSPNAPDLYYCLDKDQTYLFKIYDSYGDGLSVGNGYAKLYLNGHLIQEVGGADSWFEQQRKFT